MEELAELGQKLTDHWNKCKQKVAPPEGLYWTKEKPDLWIKPCNSVVLQVFIVITFIFYVALFLRFLNVFCKSFFNIPDYFLSINYIVG